MHVFNLVYLVTQKNQEKKFIKFNVDSLPCRLFDVKCLNNIPLVCSPTRKMKPYGSFIASSSASEVMSVRFVISPSWSRFFLKSLSLDSLIT